MGFFSSNGVESKLKWNTLDKVEQLDELVELSKEKPVLLFKHSTRCSVSSWQKSELDKKWDRSEEDIACYYLDLIQFRDVSNAITQKFDIVHESPQAILLIGGAVAYHESHNGISVDGIKAAAA